MLQANVTYSARLKTHRLKTQFVNNFSLIIKTTRHSLPRSKLASVLKQCCSSLARAGFYNFWFFWLEAPGHTESIRFQPVSFLEPWNAKIIGWARVELGSSFGSFQVHFRFILGSFWMRENRNRGMSSNFHLATFTFATLCSFSRLLAFSEKHHVVQFYPSSTHYS